jgi:hypothetical protein
VSAQVFGPLAIIAAIIGGIAWGFWRESREDIRRRTLDRAPRHPAARVLKVPGLPVDGRPLTPGEWDELVGMLFAGDARYAPAEPDYGSGRG